MKRSFFLFSAVTFSMLLFFCSCSKEQMEDVSVSEIDETDVVFFRSNVGINMGPLTLTTHYGSEDCIMSYGICLDLDPIYAPDIDLEENQAMYVAYANEEGKLVLQLDGSQHSAGFIQSMIDDPFFRLGDDVVIAEEIVVGAYEASGQTPPAGPVVLLAGEYETVFDGEQFITTVNTTDDIIVIVDDVAG